MGSRLLNGSPQLSVRVTLFPLILIVLSSTVTSGTATGTPVINVYSKSIATYTLVTLHSYFVKLCNNVIDLYIY